MSDGAYSWDQPPIQEPQENSYIELLPGKYPFRVVKFERGRFDGSEKMTACPKAIIHIEVDGGELGTTKMTSNLFLHEKCQGSLAQFFVSIGLRKHGDPLVFAWNQIVGKTGMCQTSTRTYEGKTYNDIKKFLDPPDLPPMGGEWGGGGDESF